MFLLAALGLVTLSACATPGSSDNPDAPQGTPAFEGPWAAEFLEYYSQAQSDFERGALQDGKISDQEYAEMETRMSDCLEAHEIQFSGFNAEGGYGIDFPQSMGSERANELTEECSRTSGEWSIGALYHFTQQNPENVDWSTAIAACLVSREVVAPDYTSEDWLRESAAEKYSFIVDEASGEAAVADCNRDPFTVPAG
jgi:hypothetical protein